jgi:hypothetical protein
MHVEPVLEGDVSLRARDLFILDCLNLGTKIVQER